MIESLKKEELYKRSQNIALPVIFLPTEVKPALKTSYHM